MLMSIRTTARCSGDRYAKERPQRISHRVLLGLISTELRADMLVRLSLFESRVSQGSSCVTGRRTAKQPAHNIGSWGLRDHRTCKNGTTRNANGSWRWLTRHEAGGKKTKRPLTARGHSGRIHARAFENLEWRVVLAEIVKKFNALSVSCYVM